MTPTLLGSAYRMARMLWPYRRRLLLVADEAGWILDEIAERVLQGVPASFNACLESRDWASARDCTIHFISRPWAWSDGVLDRVDRSNRLIGLWWHGRADSPDPTMRTALDRLRRVHDRFARVQVTGSIGRDTLRSIGVPAEKIVVLPEGVDVEMFRPATGASRAAMRQALGIPSDAIAIGCFQKDGDGFEAGERPKSIKGPDVLVEALAAAAAHHRLHAVLPGPARGYVTSGLRAAGIAFSAPGFVPRSELPSLYHALDLYVSPSRDEGGPAGVLEAMASGVAVVSTETGMAVDLIESGRTGTLVPSGDAAALGAAIAEAAESADRRRVYAERSLVMIAAYDWRRIIPRYVEELYRV
jgi:glycosyltransferase involved in cell wall biosynthesis